MGNNYDVIIVGGGFAGLSVASELSGSGLKVLVLEQNKVLGVNNNPVRGTFESVVDKYKLRSSVINCYDRINFYGSKSRAGVKLSNDKICLFDSARMLNVLKKRVGCKVVTGFEVVHARRRNGFIELVGLDKSYSAKVVVDASGRSSVVAQSFGVSNNKVYCKCYIAFLSNCCLNPGEAYYFSSPSISNGSAWIEPVSSTKCQIGVSTFEPYTMLTKEGLRRGALFLMKKFGPAKKMLSRARIVKGSERCIRYPIEPSETLVMDNLLIVGDAAGLATPLLGEGVRVILDMSKACAETIKDAFARKDFSAKFLKGYEKKWWLQYGKYYGWGLVLRHYIAKNFGDNEWNETIKRLDSLTQKEKEMFIKSQMNYTIFRKLTSINTTKKMLSNKLINTLPQLNMLKQRHFVSHFV